MTFHKGWIAAAGGLVVLVLLTVGAFAWATRIAHDYEKDFKQWNTQQKFKLTARTAADESLFGYDGNVDSDIDVKDVKVHPVRCEGIEGAGKIMASAAEQRPRPAVLPLKWLSPSYRKAVTADHQRSRVVNAYLAPAKDVLTVLRRDCGFEAKVLRYTAQSDVLGTKVEAITDPGADPSCGTGGCIPDEPKKLRKYSSLLQQRNDVERQAVAMFRTDECTTTSYGDTCAEVAALWTRVIDSDSAFNREVAKLKASPGYATVDSAGAEAELQIKKWEKKMRKILTRQYPGVEKVHDFAESPADFDTFLGAVAYLEKVGLKEKRDRLTALGN